jgi:hypothetical protein
LNSTKKARGRIFATLKREFGSIGDVLFDENFEKGAGIFKQVASIFSEGLRDLTQALRQNQSNYRNHHARKKSMPPRRANPARGNLDTY